MEHIKTFSHVNKNYKSFIDEPKLVISNIGIGNIRNTDVDITENKNINLLIKLA